MFISGTILQRSKTYHPQTDGLSEVVNLILQQYLRCFVFDYPRRWSKILHWAELCYNTSFHSSLAMSPFKAVYGRDPPSILDYIPQSTKIDVVDKLLIDRQDLLLQLKHNLSQA